MSAGLSVGGGKGKSKQTTNQSFNQTSTTQMGQQGRDMVTGRMDELRGQEYQGLNPDDINQWLNPQNQAVIDATTADIEAARARAAAEQRQRQLAAGPLGTSARQGIQDAELTGHYDRTLATTLAGLRSNAWDKAAGIAGSENANRNNHNMSLQQQINQLLALVAGNDTVTNSSGTSTGTTKGKQSSLNFGFAYGGG